MKTAVIYLGQARTFALCWRTHYWAVLRKLPNPTFYCAVEDDEDAESLELLKERFPVVHLRKVKTPDDLPQPSPIFEQHVPYGNSSPTSRLVRVLWNYREAWKLFEEKEPKQDPASLIVRMRPDTYYHDFSLPSRFPYPREAYFVWWGRYGGVNDRMAMMGREAAEVFFTAYDRLGATLDAGCSLHGESIMGGNLDLAQVVVKHNLDAWLSFCRPPDAQGRCQMVRPDPSMEEIVKGQIDLAGFRFGNLAQIDL